VASAQTSRLAAGSALKKIRHKAGVLLCLCAVLIASRVYTALPCNPKTMSLTLLICGDSENHFKKFQNHRNQKAWCLIALTQGCYLKTLFSHEMRGITWKYSIEQGILSWIAYQAIFNGNPGALTSA
jgi:hypothetical protein